MFLGVAEAFLSTFFFLKQSPGGLGASTEDIQQNGGSQIERVPTCRQTWVGGVEGRGAVSEEDREKLDQHKDTHGIQIIHRLDKQLARQRQTSA